MQFTARYLSDLIRSLRSHNNSAMDKRKSPRVGMRARVEIWHGSLGQMSVWMRDLSAGGANLAVPVNMNVGDELHLLLAPGSPGDPEKLGCRVMHCRKLATNMFAVGVRFDNPPAADTD
jgi:hypothetical protein